MGGASTFLALLCMIGFFAAAWGGSKIARLVGLPPLLFEIGVGLALGPQVGRLIGHEYATCTSRHFTACKLPSDIDSLIFYQEPLGSTYGRIANMHYCPKAHYDLRLFNTSNTTLRTSTTSKSPKLMVASHLFEKEEFLQNGLKATALSTGAGLPVSALEVPAEAEDLELTMSGMKAQARVQGPVVTTTNKLYNPWNRTNITNASRVRYSSYVECLEQSCFEDIKATCDDAPDLFTLIGHAGVGLAIFESSLRFNAEHFKSSAVLWSGVVAISGSVISFLTGMGLMAIYGRPLVPDAVLVGTALVPTGATAVLKLLTGLGVAQSTMGQVVTGAALIDNALALLLFDIFFSLGGEFHAFRMVGSPIIGSCLVFAAVGAALFFWPKVLNSFLLPRIRQLVGEEKGERAANEALYFIMFGILIFWAWILWMLGAYLWGCFIAGISFASLENPEGVQGMWHRQTKRWTTWLLRVFFACNVAFTIPVSMLFSGEAFWKGTVLALGPTIVAKAVSALCVGEARLLVGWSMVTRGELAFFIAQASALAGVMSNMSYCIVIWALAWAVLITPFVFYLLPRAAGVSTVSFQSAPRPVVESGVPVEDCLAGIDLEISESKAVDDAEEPVPEHSKGGLMCCLFLRESLC